MKAYLKCIGSFRQYSWGNRFLIFMHQPEATLVAGYQQWKKNYKRQVVKGAKGIPIRVPKYYIKEDDETGDKTQVRYFGVEYVYDVSQTEGDDLPLLSIETDGDDNGWLDSVITAMNQDGVSVEMTERLAAFGVSKMGKVELRADLNGSMLFSTLLHEWAHEDLHGIKERKKLTNAQKEWEAEAVAYIVCTWLDMPINSEVYLSQYSGFDLSPSMERVAKCADGLMKKLDLI